MNKKLFRTVLSIFIIIVVIVLIACVYLKLNKKQEIPKAEVVKEIYKSSSSVFSDSKLIETVNNEQYNKDVKKISDEDFSYNNLKCGTTTIADIIADMGKPDKIWKCEGEGYVGVDYVQYKYELKDEGLTLYCDFDNVTSVLKSINTYHEDDKKEVLGKTSRGVGIGTNYKDVLSLYPSGEKIYSYENNYGVYKLLYGVEDFFKVINEDDTQKNKEYAYMYYVDGKITGIYYVSNGRTITFAMDENENVSDIYMNVEINEN